MFAGVLTKALLDNADIVAAMANYKSGKAIFTGGLPDNAAFPACVITENGGTPWGCRDSAGTVFSADVSVFDDKEFTRKAISDLARLVWTTLNRATLDPWIGEEGFDNWGCTAQFPTFVGDGLNFPGYVVRVQLRVLPK